MREKFLIFGLGNPEKKYFQTFHNAGWQVVDQIASQANSSPFSQENRKECLIAEIKKPAYDLILAKPISFMNLSGMPLQKIIHFYHLQPEQILIVQDDADLPLGKIRFSFNGGSGGHNGIKSIFQETKRKDFHRLRLGIGRPQEKNLLKEYVLKKIPTSIREEWQKALERAAQGAVYFCENGPEKAASLFN